MKTVEECFQACKLEKLCTAYSFETLNTSDKNCELYTGGPYTRGDGSKNTKCFIYMAPRYVALKSNLANIFRL